MYSIIIFDINSVLDYYVFNINLAEGVFILEEFIIDSSKLKRLREHKGLKQSDMASVAGLSQPAYSKYESGKIVRFNKDIVELIAKKLGVEFSELLEPSNKYHHHGLLIQNWLQDPESVEFVIDAYKVYVDKKLRPDKKAEG